MDDFDRDREEVIHRAFSSGIGAIFCPAEITEPKSLTKTLEMRRKHPGVFAAAGVHPHQAKLFSEESANKIEDLASKKQIQAVGEIGLDFHYNLSLPHQQVAVFRRQLELAQRLKLPAIIHSRRAEKEVALAVEQADFTQGGVLHCFTESYDFARKMADRGFFISFSGIITFPNAGSLRETALKLPLDKLLVETDSPYLVPLPYRGKIGRNEPWLVKETARFLADLKKISAAELADWTSKNFESCFRLSLSFLRA